jgi:uncharacterized membrane protein YphA (DoxX/SURF4 family)
MTENAIPKSHHIREIVGLVACILIGFTFFMAGTGKLFAMGTEVPGQTIEFIGYVMPKGWLTPFSVTVLYNIVIPYVIPAVELGLGCFLLIGFIPKLMAAIAMPLTLLFMANNLYFINKGTNEVGSCACFGFWEKIFGTLTHTQSLVYDIVLFVLTLVIIIVIPGKFLQSRKWLRNLGKKKETIPVTGK